MSINEPATLRISTIGGTKHSPHPYRWVVPLYVNISENINPTLIPTDLHKTCLVTTTGETYRLSSVEPPIWVSASTPNKEEGSSEGLATVISDVDILKQSILDITSTSESSSIALGSISQEILNINTTVTDIADDLVIIKRDISNITDNHNLITSKVDNLETTVGNIIDSEDGIFSRMDLLEQSNTAIATAWGQEVVNISTKLNDIELNQVSIYDGIDAINLRIDNLSTTGDVDLSPVTDRLDALELSDSSNTYSINDLSDKVQALEEVTPYVYDDTGILDSLDTLEQKDLAVDILINDIRSNLDTNNTALVDMAEDVSVLKKASMITELEDGVIDVSSMSYVLVSSLSLRELSLAGLDTNTKGSTIRVLVEGQLDVTWPTEVIWASESIPVLGSLNTLVELVVIESLVFGKEICSVDLPAVPPEEEEPVTP